MIHKTDADLLSRQMEIGDVTEVDIVATTQKANLLTALSLALPAQVEVYAEDAGCYLFQGGVEVMDGGWAWPTHKYRLQAGERRVLNIGDEERHCIAVQRTGSVDGTLVVTETRIR